MKEKCYPPHSLAEKLIRQSPPDWRFPDQYGLSERALDCRQLAISEVLKWQGETEVIPLFLNPFDCSAHRLVLRRSEPNLQRGWRIVPYSTPSVRDFRPLIRSLLDEKGYALIFYKAFYMPFHSYYGIHDVVHWSLVVDSDEEQLTLVDSSGTDAYFSGYVGKIPWRLFLEASAMGGAAGAATILRPNGTQASWPEEFHQIVNASLAAMLEQGGLAQLAEFIIELEQTSTGRVVKELERLEFDLHYYRRLRELWKVAAEQRAIPAVYLREAWMEELQMLCRAWSLVVGLLMKWKRQPERDYHQKLVNYLWQTYANEQRFFAELGKLAGGIR
ncbi:hypothetical protein [Brevibacillus fulvus]|uniref:Uncharacterized protein n=1 Tax=Brevibacillus fulvus TaxID=1125967 RepID=A0A938XTA7_9BACL|nr:hypothetical protein [Brevibacillus fulvus]MBM7589657.1 hypothetical protein [Brevibacillus fulvus]